jgi:thermostable 8-oxoguanine DNA glycosylase
MAINPDPPTPVVYEPDSLGLAQYRILYAVVVAGKSAVFADRAMARFMDGAGALLPYDWIDALEACGRLESHMRQSRMGCYGRLTRSFQEIAKGRPDIRVAEPAELEKFHGIGPKTARFAKIWIRPAARYAALDRHVLAWLNSIGVTSPRSTPAGDLYARLEKRFIAEADRRGFTPRMLDAMIWAHCAQFRERGDTSWPAWLQVVPSPPPPDVLEYFQRFAA